MLPVDLTGRARLLPSREPGVVRLSVSGSNAAMVQKAEMKATARREFDDWAGSYDKSVRNRFLFQPSYRMFPEEIFRLHRQDPRPFRLLDVGCGTGTLAGMLVKSPLPVEVFGLDYAPAMCRVAQGKADRHGHASDAHFIPGDSEHLPFADDTFDVLTCSNSFHH